MTHAQTSEYWISPTALNITLNAMGDPNKTLGSTAAGAMVMCYVPSVDGVIGTYDNGHSYRRWSLQAYNTAFGDDDKKYVYIAIPRSVTDTNALVVFPSVEIDIYGISHSAKKDSEGNVVYVPEYEEDGTTVKTDESGNPIYTTNPVDDPKQIGSTNYYYIYLHAIISATNGTTLRTWLNEDGTASDTCSVNTGSLSTDAAIASAIATIDDLLRGMFTPVDDALNPVTNLTDMKHIRANKDFFSVGGVSSFGMGISAQPSGASYFRDLLDVPTPTSSDLGHAWGIANISSDGTPTYGWIEVGTGGKTYTNDGDYISVNNTTNKIGLNFNTLKSALNIPDVSGYGDIVTHNANEFLTSVGWGDLTSKPTSSNLQTIIGSGVYAAYGHNHSGVYEPALGYTAFNAANFTKDNIKTTLGISDWALAATKPSYAFSEITGKAAFAQLPDMYWANVKVASGSSTACEPTMKSITIGGVKIDTDTEGHLRIGGDVFATGGISAYQYGASEQALVAAFGDLTDVKASSPSNGQVWGYQSGKWQPITVQSGSTYTAGTGISISGTTISVKANTYADYGHNHDGDYLKEHQSLSAYLKVDGSNGTADGVSALINKLSEGDSAPQGGDYYVSQYAGGGTTNTTYYRRPISKLWEYIKGEADKTYLGINANAASASKLNTASSYSAWGQTYWSGGVPQTISGNMTGVGSISFSAKSANIDQSVNIHLNEGNDWGVYNNTELNTFTNPLLKIVKSNGYVGIGTKSPACKLDVNGATRSQYHLFYGTDGETNVGYIGRASDGNNNIIIHSYVNSDILINPLGTSTKVGIGTNSPASKLHIVQSGWDDGLILHRTHETGGGGCAIKVVNNNSFNNNILNENAIVGEFGISGEKSFEIHLGTEKSLYISSTNNHLTYTNKSNVAIKTGLSNPFVGFRHSFNNGTETTWYAQAYTYQNGGVTYQPKMFLGAGVANSLCITTDGKVGVGLQGKDPACKLDVNGSVRIGNGTTGSLLEWKTDGTNSWLQINSSVVATGGIAAYSNVGSDTNLANLTLTNSLTVGNTIKTITPNDDDLTIEANILSLSAEVECPKGLTIGSGHQLTSLLINQTAETSKGTYYLHLKIGGSIYRLTAYKVS